MTVNFEFRPIKEIIGDDCLFNKEKDENTICELAKDYEKDETLCEVNINKCNKKIQNSSKSRLEQWINYIEPLVKYIMPENDKKEIKGICKCQNDILQDVLSGLENTLQEAIKDINELQKVCDSKMINCSGTNYNISSTSEEEGINIIYDGIEKSGIGSGGTTFLAGGASGGAGGGLGAASEKNLGGVGGMTGSTGKILGPGATGGATGGALGSTGGASAAGGAAGRWAGGMEGRNETFDKSKRDDDN